MDFLTNENFPLLSVRISPSQRYPLNCRLLLDPKRWEPTANMTHFSIVNAERFLTTRSAGINDISAMRYPKQNTLGNIQDAGKAQLQEFIKRTNKAVNLNLKSEDHQQ
jgi:hypothetical protein